MEEVDKILILTLNQLGCDIDEEVKSVGGFGIPEVVTGVVKCIRAINSDYELPTSLPQNMAQRFRAAAAIAQAIKDVGYPGDVGYQSLLYPNETDLRKIFMFLLEKLPKDTATVSDEPLNKLTLIKMEAKRRLAESLKQPWIPPHCRHVACKYATKASVTKYGTHHTRQFASKVYTPVRNASKLSPAQEDYYKNHARTVSDILGRDYVITSLLRAHALQLERDRILPRTDTEMENGEIQLKPLYEDKENVPDSTDIMGMQSTTLSSFETSKQMIDVKINEEGMNENSGTTAATSEEKLLQKREEQVSNLQSEIAGIRDKIELSTQGMEKASDQLKELVDKLAEEERLQEEKVGEHKMKKRIANLVPESESNIKRLKEALKNSEDKMARLKQQWEAHKQPLEEQLSQLNLEVNKKKVTKEEILGEMTELRDKMKAMVQDASRKESALAQLKNQFASMNKDINRAVYTKRIIDISAKVRKQKQEIDRVLVDTRTIQKEINTLSGKLERTFTVVEGTAYKEAGNNERVRQVYRAVAAVHEGCGELVDIVRETGTVQREISELKEQVDLEKSKKVEENLEQLKVDLNQVKKENASLKQQLL